MVTAIKPTKELTIIDADYFLKGTNTPVKEKGRTIRLDQDSYIIVFTGRRGGGKTTDMVFFAVRAVILYNTKIVSNFPIEFMLRRHKPDGTTYLQHIKSEPLDFEKLILMDEEYKNALILIDEAPDIISHMAASGWRNRLINAFVRQLRKGRNSLFLGAQDFELIDKSIRWQVDIEAQCKDASRFINDPTLLKGSVLWVNWYDNSGVWTNFTTEDRLRHGVDPCVSRTQVKPCILWGDDAHLPVFDSWRPIDIMESIRRVEIKMATIKIGDKAEENIDTRFPVSPKAIYRALSAVKKVLEERKDNPAIYQKEFYSLCSPLSSTDKNNLGKILAEFGVEKGRANNGDRYYNFGETFKMEDFTDLVMRRQAINE